MRGNLETWEPSQHSLVDRGKTSDIGKPSSFSGSSNAIPISKLGDLSNIRCDR